jgi:predicted unusual protein kinase regulating ubiquinone biosynthesis (AarF/ABC1/UbiB family)
MNLLWFLTSIIQYNLSWDKPASIQKIKQAVEEAGPVWQKFAQTLSGQEDLIGKDLANELQDILCNCPKHSDSYSKKVIRLDFGDKYDLSDMELIGSGTIAQVYRVADVCIKVRHPNVAEDVMSAVKSYNSIRNTIPFMPVALKQVCDNFFTGIEEQLDFHREFHNGNTFRKLLHNCTRPENNLYIIPRMLDKSDECIVMDYEPSKPLVMKGRSKLDKHTMLKALHGILLTIYISVLQGFIHADLHMGNYGVRGSDDNLQIVIYDFGHMYDVRDLSRKIRHKFVAALELYDFNGILQCFLDEHHQQHITKQCDIQLGNKKLFDINMKYLVRYITLNGIKMQQYGFQIMISMEKSVSSSDLLFEVESDKEYRYMKIGDKLTRAEYYDTYFPYDDVRILADFAKGLEEE